MAFAHLPCYDIMEKVGQQVEAIRTHKAQVEQLRIDTLDYHYKRLCSYWFSTETYYFPHINSFKNNHKQVIAQIGRNSQYSTNGIGKFLRLNLSCRNAVLQADLNAKIYKLPDGGTILTNGKCIDRWGRPFVPLA